MIRHKSSFFISLSIHALLFISLYFAWSGISKVQRTHLEHKICVELCRVEHQQKSIEPVKEQIAKPQPKIEPKQKPKPIIKQALPKQIQETPKEISPEIAEISQDKPNPISKVEITKNEEALTHVLLKPKKEDVKQEQDGSKDQYIKINTQKISELIRDNLYYPIAARKRNITGRVSIRFTLGVDAKVYYIKVVDSSSDILSRAAVKTIEELSGKFPKPEQEITLNLPIDYALN
ncbi:TonB family protein [Sulfurimonas sp.]|jgi:protein TonB|uniref:TonB family protein n=1 Tax=Sulfurimonas sp. TaxID=2022749 RepID=UPI0025CD3579|nr:TonB family protein [Sulfurimonas sp.]MCK9472383.1 TonB family protein [Sulfurimonas sp.]